MVLFECPVCFEELSELKMLPCKHTFCLDCLNKMAHPGWPYVPLKKISCPLCRAKHVLPNIGTNLEPIYSAEGFPSNLTMPDWIKQKSTLVFEFMHGTIGHIFNSVIRCVWRFYEISNHLQNKCEYQEENCRYCVISISYIPEMQGGRFLVKFIE